MACKKYNNINIDNNELNCGIYNGIADGFRLFIRFRLYIRPRDTNA